MSHVFISYSKKDKDYARRLANHLLAHGFDVWIDDRIDYGENWLETMFDAVVNCAVCVVVMTPESRRSRWVQREVAWADERNKRFFPVLLAGENWPVFVLTQYADARSGELPDVEFIQRIGEYAPSKAPRGTDIIEELGNEADDFDSYDDDEDYEEVEEDWGDATWDKGEDSGRQEQMTSVPQSTKNTLGLPEGAYSFRKAVAPVQFKLLSNMTNINISPEQRAKAGRELAEIGDPRVGVGLRADGLPDIDWVEIPGGKFIYGDEEESNGPLALTLPTFWMARYPITYQQFQAFVESDDGFRNPQWWKGLAADEEHKAAAKEQEFKYWNHPRDNVAWWDAVAFCKWLSARLAHEITLPTERQWERAARGTDGRRYPWGPEYVAGHANINERAKGDGPHFLRQTSTVGLYVHGASPEGVLDMSGNVWEWCLNEYDNPNNNRLRGWAPRVWRGGSWDSNALRARCACRFRYYAYLRLYIVGFRVCTGTRPKG